MTRKELYLSLFEQLNEPERTQAKENIKLCHDNICEDDIFSNCIKRGFIWKNTPQGHEYWSKIHFLIENGEYRKNMTKEELRDIYFGFYDQLNEPERSEAKTNWNQDFAQMHTTPSSIEEAILRGFCWSSSCQKRQYWKDIHTTLSNESYDYKNNNSFFKEITEGICELLEEKDKRYGSALDNPLEIFAGKSKFGVRIDEKLSRIKNSETLRLNDVADIMGYLTHLIKEQGWTKQDILNLID